MHLTLHEHDDDDDDDDDDELPFYAEHPQINQQPASSKESIWPVGDGPVTFLL